MNTTQTWMKKLASAFLVGALFFSIADSDSSEARRRRASKSSSGITDTYVGAGLGPTIGFTNNAGSRFGLNLNGGVRMKNLGFGGFFQYNAAALFTSLLWFGGTFKYHMDNLLPIPGFWVGAQAGLGLFLTSIPGITFVGGGSSSSSAGFFFGPATGLDYRIKDLPISVGGEVNLPFVVGVGGGLIVYMNILAMAKYHF